MQALQCVQHVVLPQLSQLKGSRLLWGSTVEPTSPSPATAPAANSADAPTIATPVALRRMTI